MYQFRSISVSSVSSGAKAAFRKMAARDRTMVKDNPIHKQQIDPVLMADRFPYYDLDGRLVADAHEIAELAAGHDEPIGRAYWTAFNALPPVRTAEGELLETHVRGSTRHILVKSSPPAGRESGPIPSPTPHMPP